MFERTQKLLSYEWWERVTPKALPVVSVIGIRMALDNAAGLERVKDTALTVNQASRSMFTPMSIKPEDVTLPYYLAGIDANMKKDTAAGTRAEGLDGWNYFSAAFDRDMTAFGKAPDASISLRGTDFIPHGKGFLFHDNPAKYTTATYDDADLRYILISIGDALAVTHRPQDDIYFSNTANRTARRAIVHALYGSGYTSGISGVTVEAARGIESPLKDGKIVHIWREGKFNFVATENEVLRVPVEYEIAVNIGDDIEAGDCLVKDERPEMFIVPAKGVSYVMFSTQGDVRRYPLIPEEFPELRIEKDGTFSNIELYQLLKSHGIVIKDVKSAVDASAAKALSRYMVPDSMTILQQRVDVEVPLTIEMEAVGGNSAEVEMPTAASVEFKCWNFI